MKVVNLNQFREMPEGTVYCKYDPVYFGELSIKGETIKSDFYSARLSGEVKDNTDDDATDVEYIDMIEKVIESGESFSFDLESYSRDGLYDGDQLFSIYEKEDIEGLINQLKKSLSVSEIFNNNLNLKTNATLS